MLIVQTEGCSGAEIISICQDAALTTMNEDPNAPFVSPATHLELSADSSGEGGASHGVGTVCQKANYARDDCFLRVLEGSEWGTECLGGIPFGTVAIQCSF